MRPAFVSSRGSLVLIVAAALALALLLGWTTLGLRTVTADDWAIEQGLASPEVALANRVHDFRIGRFYADRKFEAMEAQQRLGAGVARAVVRVGSLAVAAAALAWFIAACAGETTVATLVLLLALGMAPVSIGYSALLSYSLLWWGWAAVWVMGALAVGPRAVQRRWPIALAYLVALLVHEANLIFLFVPVVVHSLSVRSWSGRTAVRLAGPALAVAVAYVGLFLLMRSQALGVWPGDTYAGARIEVSTAGYVHALFAYTLSGLPILETMLLRSADPGADLFRSIPDWGYSAVCAPWGGVAAAVLLGLAVWALLRHRVETERALPVAGLIALLVAVAFGANALLAATAKYQLWSHQRMWPYYYTGMSYLAWCGVLALLVRGAARVVGSNCFSGGVAVVLAAGGLAVAAANAESAGLLRQHRFDHINTYRVWFANRPIR